MKHDWDRQEKIGIGNEKKIYPHENDPKKLIARWHPEKAVHETPERAKGRYYLTKILHLIFPKNIPDIYQISKKGDDMLSAHMERKQPDAEHSELQALRLQAKQLHGAEKAFAWNKSDEAVLKHRKAIFEDKRYEELLHAMWDLGVYVDSGPINFGYDEEENMLYLDNSFVPWRFDTEGQFIVCYDGNKLREAMKNLGEADRERASLYLERLEELTAGAREGQGR